MLSKYKPEKLVMAAGPILRPFSGGGGNFYIKIIKHWRAEGARENFGIFDEKGEHFGCFFVEIY